MQAKIKLIFNYLVSYYQAQYWDTENCDMALNYSTNPVLIT